MYKSWKPKGVETGRIRIIGEMPNIYKHYVHIHRHWQYPNRQKADIVMTANEEGVYEYDSGCMVCNILQERTDGRH